MCLLLATFQYPFALHHLFLSFKPAPENTDKEAEQQNLWDAAEQAMKESNDSVLNSLEQKGLGPSDDNDANKESQLWQVAEGRLELEECF